MAISIITNPQRIMPVYNPIVWTVSSTNTTECNFRYTCDIYISTTGSQTGTYITTLKVYPTGDDDFGIFKINRILEDHISYDLQHNLYGFGVNPNSAAMYILKFGEEYDVSTSCTAGTTIYPDLTVTSKYYFFNASFQYKSWLDYLSTEYTAYTTSKKFLTNQPSYVMTDLGQQSVINFMNFKNAADGINPDNKFKRAYITTYDSVGSVIGNYSIANPYYLPDTEGSNGTTQMIQSIGVGPDNLNNATLATGAQPVITASVSTYSVVIQDNTNTATAPTMWFTLDSRCSKFEPKTLWWLNRLGGFDSYSYTMRNTKTITSTRTEFTKVLGGLTGDSPNDWTYSIGDRGRTTMSVSAKEKNTYQSNWLTELEAAWQEELFTSGEVYMSDTDGLDPVIITSQSFEEKTYKTTKNINYIIDVEKAYEISIQRN